VEQPKITAAREEPGLHEKLAENISGVFLQFFGEEDWIIKSAKSYPPTGWTLRFVCLSDNYRKLL